MAQPVQKKTKCERTFLFTPVSLIEGNPWQEIDEGSDAALDTCMRQDRHSKVACDTATKGTMVKVAGLPPHMITPKFTKPARLEKEGTL
jgi:S-adenosylmethionine synthetase